VAAGGVVDDVAGVGQRARQPIELGHHERVPGTARRERLAQAGPVAVSSREAVVDVEPLGRHAERLQGVALRGEVLAVGRHAGVADGEVAHSEECPA
jgi:hypothetical protein